MANENTTPFPGLTLDLAGQRAVTVPSARLPRGAFEVVIKSLDQYQKEPSSKPQGRFITQVTEVGDFKGMDSYVFIGLEAGPNNVNHGRWKAAMLSAGAPAAIAEQNGVRIAKENFEGKRAFIFNEPGDSQAAEGSPERRDNRYFITPEEYTKIKTGTLKVPERPKSDAAPVTPSVAGATQIPPAMPVAAIPSPTPAAPNAINGTPAAAPSGW